MFLIVLITICLVFGQLLRLSISESGAIVFNDLVVPLVLAMWVAFGLLTKKFKIEKTPINIPLALFLTVAFFSYFINLSNVVGFERLQSLAYFLRLLSYSLIFFAALDVIKSKEIFNKFYSLIIWVGLVFAVFGFLQLVFFPSFEAMTQYGWDPHVKRLLSTFFDPNYAGGFLVFVNALVLARMLFCQNKTEKGLWFFAFLFLTLAIIFTYSRSAYLAFAVVILVIGIFKSWRLLLFGALALVIAFFSFPRVQERILGGFSLDVTAKMRLENYQEAQKIIEDNLIIGVGYNNLRAVREEYGQVLDVKSHAAGGFDSSFLTILATTGVLGFAAYLWLLWRILKDAFKEFWDKKSPPVLRGLGLGIFAGILSLIIHSQFVNSLLYPHIMLYMFIVLGLFYAGKRSYKEN